MIPKSGYRFSGKIMLQEILYVSTGSGEDRRLQAGLT